MLRVISECLPRYAIFENVSGLLRGDGGRWFARFLYDLAAIGYDAEWNSISASYIGAPHHRDRVWIIAYPNNNGHITTEKRQGVQKGNGSHQEGKITTCKPSGLFGERISANTDNKRCERKSKISNYLQQQIEFMRSDTGEGERFNLSQPALCGANDGVSNRSQRLKALGNAVVPQIPEAIGKAILNYERVDI